MRNFRPVIICFGFLFGCGQGPGLSPIDQQAMAELEQYQPIRYLDNHGRVIDLRLEGEKVEAGALEAVVRLKELRQLSLYGTQVTDQSLPKLTKLKWLESLGLGVTQITDAGLDHLEKMKRLRWLWLSKGKVTEERIEELKKKLRYLTVYWQ